MAGKKVFDVDKHLSRLITHVELTVPTSISDVEPSEIKRVASNITTNDLADIIKNAVKLDTLGQYEEALSWYDKALKLDPKDINTMFKKALLLSKTGKYEQAVFLFDQVIEIDPTLVSALVNRKIVLEKLGKHFGVVHLSDKQLS
ncbi:MAG: tetratricopeptide repeat protein [Nitrosopumilaceae archaeon]